MFTNLASQFQQLSRLGQDQTISIIQNNFCRIPYFPDLIICPPPKQDPFPPLLSSPVLFLNDLRKSWPQSCLCPDLLPVLSMCTPPQLFLLIPDLLTLQRLSVPLWFTTPGQSGPSTKRRVSEDKQAGTQLCQVQICLYAGLIRQIVTSLPDSHGMKKVRLP